MLLLEEIRKTNKKPKELLVYLASLVKKNKSILKDFADSLKNSSDAERGICIETLEYVSKDSPDIAEPHVETVISYLNDKAPRVKWEAARIIANISRSYPEKAVKAVENLMKNATDKGTVVRWSSAFALGEIAKNNKSRQKELIKTLENFANKEQNNGVKNVYLKALEAISKN